MATTTPPPTYSNIPDYYLGYILYYDGTGKDNCRWVVYDGQTRVRCVTRSSAIAYIKDMVITKTTDDDLYMMLLDARMSFARAMHCLTNSTKRLAGVESLRINAVAAKIKPVLTEIDNIILPAYEQRKSMCTT